MADPKSSTAVMVATPVTVLAPTEVIEFNLDGFPADKYNRLLPTQTIRVPSDLMAPVVQVVQLDLSRDAYESPDVPKGSKAIGRTGLRKLATAAGISFLDERRTDDGSNPDVCEVTCLAEMTLPTGQRLRATGMKRVDLRVLKWSSPAHKAKFQQFFQEHVSSRAQNRAIRALLSLQASYPIAELAKPFAVVSYGPNMNHPDIRARVLDAVAPAIAAGFGPEPRQLGAGSQPAEVTQVEPAPDDDDDAAAAAYEAQQTTQGTEAAWSVFGGDDAPDPAAEAREALTRNLRAKAEGSDLEGAASTDQKQALAAKLLAPLGVDLVAAGLRAVWGIERAADGKLVLTAAQAYALIEITRHDDLLALWRSAFGSAAAA